MGRLLLLSLLFVLAGAPNGWATEQKSDAAPPQGNATPKFLEDCKGKPANTPCKCNTSHTVCRGVCDDHEFCNPGAVQ